VLPRDIVAYYRRAPKGKTVPFSPGVKVVTEHVLYSCGRGTVTGVDPVNCEGLVSTVEGATASPRIILVVPSQDHSPEVRIAFRFPDEVDMTSWVWSSDSMSPRHGDFMAAWDRRTLQAMITKCLAPDAKCGQANVSDLS
jgi:hypothetical protein